mgnify:CR=1 FL=1
MRYDRDYTSVGPIDVFDPVYDNNDLADLATVSDALRRQKQAGLYVQDLIELGGWNFTAGLRQDWYDVSIDDYQQGTKDANTGDKLSGHLGVLYAFENGLSPYLSYSTSFNPTSNYSDGAQILKPTTGEQKEIGIKYQMPQVPVLLTAAVFDITQDNVLRTDPNSMAFQAATGQVESKGVELEAKLALKQG